MAETVVDRRRIRTFAGRRGTAEPSPDPSPSSTLPTGSPHPMFPMSRILGVVAILAGRGGRSGRPRRRPSGPTSC